MLTDSRQPQRKIVRQPPTQAIRQNGEIIQCLYSPAVETAVELARSVARFAQVGNDTVKFAKILSYKGLKRQKTRR